MERGLHSAVVTMTHVEYLQSQRMTPEEREAFRHKYGIPSQHRCDHLSPKERLEHHAAQHGYHECEH